jgi:hypothetical protein
MAVFFVFNGFLAPKRSIPDAWIWMYYISMFTHSYKGLALNENKALKFSCSSGQLVPPSGFGFENLGFTSSDPSFPCSGDNGLCQGCSLRNGDDILNQYDMNSDSEDDKWILLIYQV